MNDIKLKIPTATFFSTQESTEAPLATQPVSSLVIPGSFEPGIKEKAALVLFEITEHPISRLEVLKLFGRVGIVFFLPWVGKQPERTGPFFSVARTQAAPALPDYNDFDPVIPLPLLDVIEPRFKNLMRPYIQLLIEWRESFSTGQHALWGQQVKLYRDALTNYAAGMEGLSRAEREFFIHWLKLCVINPKWGTEAN